MTPSHAKANENGLWESSSDHEAAHVRAHKSAHKVAPATPADGWLMPMTSTLSASLGVSSDQALAGVLIPSLFRLFEEWGLTGQQQMVLLGLQNEKTLYNWKRQPEKAKLGRDTVERASYLLGIYKALDLLLPEPGLAKQWLHTANDHPLFNHTPPIQRLLAGHVVDLYVVRAHLDEATHQ